MRTESLKLREAATNDIASELAELNGFIKGIDRTDSPEADERRRLLNAAWRALGELNQADVLATTPQWFQEKRAAYRAAQAAALEDSGQR